MSETALRLKDELLRLPVEDRRQLANLLWDSLDGPSHDDTEMNEAAWVDELERRSAEADADSSQSKPFREVIAELRGELP